MLSAIVVPFIVNISSGKINKKFDMDYKINKIKSNVALGGYIYIEYYLAIDEKDYLIGLCKDTGINSIVIELKGDSGNLMFESDTAKSIYNETFGLMTKEEFKQLIAELNTMSINIKISVANIK